MSAFLASLPILLVIVLMVGFNWSAKRVMPLAFSACTSWPQDSSTARFGSGASVECRAHRGTARRADARPGKKGVLA